MYAIFETGGRQYWAQPEEIIRVDSLGLKAGDKVEFDKVLVLRNDDEDMQVGRPYIDGAKVVATVVAQGRDKKIRVFTYKAKKHSKRNKGHRQDFTAIRVEGISA